MGMSGVFVCVCVRARLCTCISRLVIAMHAYVCTIVNISMCVGMYVCMTVCYVLLRYGMVCYAGMYVCCMRANVCMFCMFA